MPKIIFVCGVHGSGKTTLGQKLSEILHLSFDTASNIIKKVMEQNWDNEKRVKDIVRNQEVLLHGINSIYSHHKIIILDGHFTLLNEEKEIYYIPIETFRNLNISCIIPCIASIQSILERLRTRDGNTSFDVNILNKFQESEIKHANKISNQLGVPIIFYNSNKENPEDLIDKLIKDGLL